MTSISISPWRNDGQLLQVCDWLYHPSGTGQTPDLRRKACGQIQAWKLRGGLPHAVESTWYITDAILADSSQDGSISALARRFCYSTAICRFVTGLLDSQQDGAYKKSMYDVAKELELPAFFVELRHEAIHGELPSLVVLRQAAERSLRWLWDTYWRKVREGGQRGFDGLNFENRFRETLQDYAIECRRLTRTPEHRTNSLPADQVSAIAAKLTSLSKGGKQALMKLIRVLVEVMLVLTNFRGQSETEVVFVPWDQLLDELAMQHQRFLRLLADEMCTQLTAPQDSAALPEGAFLWLEHIYTTTVWSRAAKHSGLDDVLMISRCLQSPNQWTIRLASSIAQHSKCERVRRAFDPIIADATKDVGGTGHISQKWRDSGVRRDPDDFDGWQKSRTIPGGSIGII